MHIRKMVFDESVGHVRRNLSRQGISNEMCWTLYSLYQKSLRPEHHTAQTRTHTRSIAKTVETINKCFILKNINHSLK